MKMTLMTAGGAAEIGNWLERPERDVAQGQQRSRLRTLAAGRTQVSPAGTTLLSLQTEMRRDASNELGVLAVLWALSWGAVALLCV